MVINAILIIFAIVLMAIIINIFEDYNKKQKQIHISFKEAMDLVELPVVTFYNKGKKLNFLLDTGSNISCINKSVLSELNYNNSDKKTSIMGIEANRAESFFCKMEIAYKNKLFSEEFAIRDLDDAFSIVKAESGVQIHGILGSLFFQKYKYVLDFENLVAYFKK